MTQDRAYTVLIDTLESLCPPQTSGSRRLMVDESNGDAFRAVAQWIAIEAEGPLHPDRGIRLAGPVGTGKSLLMRALSRVMMAGGELGFRVLHTKAMVQEYNRKTGGADYLRSLLNGHLCIDELGAEDEGLWRKNVIGELIDLRWNDFEVGAGWLTHFTTNETPDDLRQMYGERTWSRIKDLSTAMILGGPDRRGQAGARPIRSRRDHAAALPAPSADEVVAGREALAAFMASHPRRLSVVQSARPRQGIGVSDVEDQRLFTAKCVGLDRADLLRLRAAAEANTEQNVKPYLVIIDAALAALPSGSAQDGDEDHNAANG